MVWQLVGFPCTCSNIISGGSVYLAEARDYGDFNCILQGKGKVGDLLHFHLVTNSYLLETVLHLASKINIKSVLTPSTITPVGKWFE